MWSATVIGIRDEDVPVIGHGAPNGQNGDLLAEVGRSATVTLEHDGVLAPIR
jgi:hypothetical protein